MRERGELPAVMEPPRVWTLVQQDLPELDLFLPELDLLRCQDWHHQEADCHRHPGASRWNQSEVLRTGASGESLEQSDFRGFFGDSSLPGKRKRNPLSV